MKAIVFDNYGSPDVLKCVELEKPIPKSDEVLIKVRAASVNPLDWRLMRGRPYFMRLMTGWLKPRRAPLGVDVSGQVETVGENVAQFKPGDEVFGACGSGSFAEYACASESTLIIKPKNVTFEQAAAVNVGACTALQGLRDAGRIQPGQQVLINGAAGGVGLSPCTKDLATVKDDARFEDFQRISDAARIIVGIGVPLKNESGVSISMIVFQPRKARQIYSKKYLHSDETAFFVSGKSSIGLIGGKARVALAICYELSVPEHSAEAFRRGAKIYLASAAKTAAGVEKAAKSLSEIAEKYAMTVFLSNFVGRCDNFKSAGNSAVWNENGFLAGQLNNSDEGVIIYDTATQETIEKII
jgi:hypothetical protein